MRGAAAGPADRERRAGLIAQVKNPPGGRDARTMLFALFLDRTGSGMWSAVSVLYFTFVAGLDARHVGLLLGVAGATGIAGSPLAGRLAGRLPLRSLLIACHLVRMAAVALLLVCGGFGTLLPVVAVVCVTDRAAKTCEVLFATRAAGRERTRYRALSRVMMNAGYAVGAGVAAVGLVVGTRGAYSALVLGNAVSFLLAAALVSRTREVRHGNEAPARNGTRAPAGARTATRSAARHEAAAGRSTVTSPWRDPGYLLFVLLDTPLNIDDAVLNVGLPLWLVNHTGAPHTVVPAFLIINNVLVVGFQMPVSARIEGPRRALVAVTGYGAALLACCVLVAMSAGRGAVVATVLLLGAAVAVTGAEMMRSVSSWELSVAMAPSRAQAAYLGVAGVSQAVAKSAGPVVLTDAVMIAGPAGWLVLGTAVTGLSLLQRRCSARRLDALDRDREGDGGGGPGENRNRGDAPAAFAAPGPSRP
jgi:hypothetical protein